MLIMARQLVGHPNRRSRTMKTNEYTIHPDAHRPARRSKKVRGLRALLATGAIAMTSATALVTSASPVAAASQVQVTYCWTYGSFQPLPAGYYTYAQYYDGSRNNWVTPAQNYNRTNSGGCVSNWVTSGLAWRFNVWANGRWHSDSGSHVSSSGGYLGMTRV
jgi:hypothetical protein